MAGNQMDRTHERPQRIQARLMTLLVVAAACAMIAAYPTASSSQDAGEAVASATCTPSDTNLCLQGGRFRVEVSWSDFVGNGGAAHTVPNATPDTGLFYFYGPNNWELLIKVLDACGSGGGRNDHFWVFGAAATTLEFTVTVTDTLTGESKDYSNALGNEASAITDTLAFDTCNMVPPPTPTPTPPPHHTPTPEPPPACCKHCTTGQPCGDSCISRNFTCHQPPGCAC